MQHVNPQILTMLSRKFDSDVNEADVLNWLYNFEEPDWQMALHLLTKVNYYGEKRCIEVLTYGLNQIINDTGDEVFLIIPVAGVGKSGHMIAYIISKIIKEDKNTLKSKCFLDTTKVDLAKPFTIILLDDFSGSGKSIADFWHSISDYYPKPIHICALTVTHMLNARKNLAKENIMIYGIEHVPAFAQRKSPFGGVSKMRLVRSFAEKYGQRLYPKKMNHRGLYIGPLGYACSQSLVCFHHTTPNNTLPILWACKKDRSTNKPWRPLFPRSVRERINSEDDFYRNREYWKLMVFQLFGCNANSDYQRTRFLCNLVGLLYYRVRRRSEAFICQMLDITISEYQALIVEGQRLKLMDAHCQITEEGRKVFLKLKSKHDDNKQVLIEAYIKPEALNIYIPIRFLGLSRSKAFSQNPLEQPLPADIFQSLD